MPIMLAMTPSPSTISTITEMKASTSKASLTSMLMTSHRTMTGDQPDVGVGEGYRRVIIESAGFFAARCLFARHAAAISTRLVLYVVAPHGARTARRDMARFSLSPLGKPGRRSRRCAELVLRLRDLEIHNLGRQRRDRQAESARLGGARSFGGSRIVAMSRQGV